MDLSPAYLTKQHACILSDLKKRSLETAIRAGQVRAFRIGRKVLVEWESLSRWIQSHEITPTDRQVAKSELQRLMDSAIEQARRRTA